MRFGISIPNIGEAARLVELGVETDEAGWDGFFVWDHVAFSAAFPVPVLDPWVVLGAVAARTERARLGTMVTPLARRRPWKVARETVTLDHLSRGRAVLGVGLGRPRDADFDLLGEDPDERVRARALDEGLELLARLWSGDPVEHRGERYRVTTPGFQPVPLQRPRIPVWVAGMWPATAPFRRAARWDGAIPIGVTPGGEPAPLPPAGVAEVVAYVARHRAPRAGDFDVVAGATGADAAVVAGYAAAGATWYLADAGVQGPGWEDATLELIRGGPPTQPAGG